MRVLNYRAPRLSVDGWVVGRIVIAVRYILYYGYYAADGIETCVHANLVDHFSVLCDRFHRDLCMIWCILVLGCLAEIFNTW